MARSKKPDVQRVRWGERAYPDHLHEGEAMARLKKAENEKVVVRRFKDWTNHLRGRRGMKGRGHAQNW